MSSHEHQPRSPPNPSWIWSGVHGASGIVHPFFAMRDDPDQRYSGPGVHFDTTLDKILASSGGLLLVKPYQPNMSTRSRLAARLAARLRRRVLGAQTDDQSNNPPEGDPAQASLQLRQHWQTLHVINPSTQECRVLPPGNSIEIGLEFWSYNAVQANLLVDADSQTYTVTLTYPDFVCLYKSTSNAWQYRRLNQGASWRSPNIEFHLIPWEMEIANAYVNGRLFFADVVVTDDLIYTMNLIELDAEAGTWKLHSWRYPLQCFQTHFTEFLNTPFLRMRGWTDRGALNRQTRASRRGGRLLEDFQIVECMGELYAVIPMGLSEYLPMSLRRQRTLTEVIYEYANFGLIFMPLQFLIVNMRGDGFVHGVLRIVVPEDVNRAVGKVMGIAHRKKVLMEMLEFEPNKGFSCVAEGSVIWVALLDYVLQYDVVTGVSKTEITGPSDPRVSLDIWVERVPYRPSNMKP